ncbi:HDOD domain-containing protein [Rhodoferax sp.]|uniref:HDOD domain-containing protein n=1 Tax=Rhodoferax sp. TaxID=50421 RepID=UPI002852D300|nr:HDOD domain-containing protein [Rhodoferax sp.]
MDLDQEVQNAQTVVIQTGVIRFKAESSGMGALSPDLALRLTAAVDSMPAFPKSVQKILTLTRDVACAPKDLVQVIDKDPVVTVKVLRVVNSAYYGLVKQITSVDQAVVFLGFNAIKNLALSIAAISMLPESPMAGFDGQRYLLHSLTCASLARQLAHRLPGSDPQDCFIAGLLHDFGKVVVAQFMPVEFRRAMELSLWKEVSLHVALQEVVGVDHAAIGAMLAQKWHFADELVQTIACQHQPEQYDTDMMACVFAANQLSKQLGFDFGGRLLVQALAPTVAQRLGGQLEDIMDSLGDITSLIEEARVFSRL